MKVLAFRNFHINHPTRKKSESKPLQIGFGILFLHSSHHNNVAPLNFSIMLYTVQRVTEDCSLPNLNNRVVHLGFQVLK